MRSIHSSPCWALLLSTVAATSASANVLHVPSQYGTIQAALNAAVSGDTVLVEPGTYTGPDNKNLDFHGKNVTLKCNGNGAPDCIIDCQRYGRGFYFHSGEGSTARVIGFTVLNGHPTASEDFTQRNGGGVYIDSGSPTFMNCVIRNNHSGRCGGGVSVTGGSPTFINCLIIDNWGLSGAGGLDAYGSGTCVLRNCTISGNHADIDTGGVSFYGGNGTLTNCIVWNNTGGHGQPQIMAYPATTTVAYSDVQGGWSGPGQAVLNVDPLFMAPRRGNYHLAVGSPCIDAGDPSFVPQPGETDIDAEPRLMDGDDDFVLRVDMGADEHNNDCNYNGVPDNHDIAGGTSQDCNFNGIPDECELANVADPDCNQNGILDICEIAAGTSADCDGNGVPDECQDTSLDCNGNGVWDACDLASGLSTDFNWTGVPDECESIVNVPTPDLPTIQSGVNVALPGSTVLVAPGTYSGPGNQDIDFGEALALVCDAGPGEACVIDCQYGGRGFYMRSGPGNDGYLMRLSGFTIVNGLVDSADGGGGIFLEISGAPTISNCVIRDCTSMTDGGAVSTTYTPIFTDCVIVDNVAMGRGGGIYCNGGAPLVVHCTVANNEAGTRGGGIFHSRYCTLRNSVVWNNRAPQNPQLGFDTYETTATYSIVQGGWPGTGNLDLDPLFADPAHADYHLLPNSPAVDAGDPLLVPQTGQSDLDGQPRVRNLCGDMGADEVYPNDCNGNGVPDIIDIANGTSADCSGNRIPDECETDCDGNGVADSCDILAGTRIDRNENGVPDACEPHVWLYVDDDAPGDPAPGDPTISDPLEDGSPAHPFDGIQEAISAAGSGYNELVDIIVRDGTYTGATNRNLSFGGRSIWITSENGAATCVIDCQAGESNPARGFAFTNRENPAARIAGFTIRNGWFHGWQGSAGGGGILCAGSSPTIEDCVVTDNTLFWGGGAGICCSYGGHVTIRNCTVRNNTILTEPPYAWDGGGIVCLDASASVLNCTVTGNASAIFYSQGGGLAVVRGLLDLRDSLIARNRAYHQGGALDNYFSRTDVSNCTFTENQALQGDGGCIFFAGGTLTVRNSILWGDIAPGGPEFHADYYDGALVSVAYCDVGGGLPFGVIDDGGNIDVDPLFVAPGDGDYHLSATSPCIDAGHPAFVPLAGEVDFDGQTRLVDGNADGVARVDMGADEFRSVLVGDVDCDGTVGFRDINPFVLALSNPAGYEEFFPDCDISSADINGDGAVGLEDINPFIALLTR